MKLFNGVISISNISTLLFVVFSVLLLGYLLGRITVKGISLGDAGVFIIALLFGALFFKVNAFGDLVFAASSTAYDFEPGLSILESLGLVLFVTSVGYIAGPKFFGNFKRNFKSYVLLGVIIILAGGLSAAACIGMGEVIGETMFEHIEKADADYLGAHQMMVNAFVQTCVPEGVKYLNREDDAQDPGLRKSKQSYHPLFLTEKFDMKVEEISHI